MSDVINGINSKIDEAFELTQLPKLGRWAAGGVGRGFDELVGTNIAPVVEQIGGDLPRMTAEAMLTLPMAASGAGTPAAAAMWMNRLRRLGQVAGYGSAGVSGWEHTGSPIGGAINMATLGAGNKLFTAADRGGLDVGLRGQEFAEGLAGFKPRATPALELAKDTLTPNLAKGTAESVLDAKTLFQQLVGGVGRGATDVATGVGLAEASRQASMSVGPNGVGLTDEARNPFTAENIAGNVMNALPMAVGAISAAKAKFRPKQVEEMATWSKTRQDALKAEAGYDYEGPLTPTQWHDAKGEVPYGLTHEEKFGGLTDPLDEALAKRSKLAFTSNAIAKSIGAHFTALEQQLAENNGEGAEQSYRMIHRAFQGGQDLMTPEGRGYLEQRIKEHDGMARQMVPGSAPELVGFVEEVNKTIGMWNAEYKKNQAVREAQVIEPNFKVGSMEDLKRFNAAKEVAKKLQAEKQFVAETEGKTWSQAAGETSPEQVALLEGHGLIKPLTEDWFKSAMTEELKRSTPEEAYQIVLQKAVNEKLGQVKGAIEEYKKLPQPDTTAYESQFTDSATVKQKEIDDIDRKHYTNYLKFPTDLREELFLRDAQVRGRGDFGVNGRLQHRFPAWRKALDLAAKTYDPTTDTFEVYGKKGNRRVPSDFWTQLDENGDYVNEIASAPLTVAEGGTPHQGNKAELTLTDLTSKDTPGIDPLERLDEEMYKSEQADVSVPGSLAEKTSVLDSTTKGGEQVIPEQGLYMSEEQAKSGMDLFETKQKVQKKIAELSNDEMYYAGKSAFSGEGTANKKKLFKSAVLAALEDSQTGKGVEVGPSGQAFLEAKRALGENPAGKSEKDQLRRALKAYFGFQVEPPFKGAVRADPAKIETRYDMQRLAHIVTSLLDDKKVEMAKSVVLAQGGTPGAPKAMVRPSSPIQFAAPIRLRRWLEKPTGAFSPDVKGEIPTKSVRNLLQKVGVSQDEMALYDAAGLDKFLSRHKVGTEELAKWMDGVTPEVETVKGYYEDQQVNRKQEAYQHLQHEAETQGFRAVVTDHVGNDPSIFEVDRFERLDGSPFDPHENGTTEQQRLADDIISLGYDTRQTKEVIPFYPSIAPKETKNMPGAVTVLVRNGSEEMRDNHFGESGKGLVSWVRGYMEIAPNGEKTFHVFEVQGSQKGLKEQAPLDKVYEQIALKAAIKHAREQGATRIALSDAETMMMTEGHDRMVDPALGRYTDANTGAEITRPPQEPGMRAAYDIRLPNILEKLTGEKGRPEDFGMHNKANSEWENDVGSPVFKDATGGRKKNISARSYSLANVDDTFSAFGYAKPAEGDVAGAPAYKDTLYNTQKPGSFTPDVYRTVRANLTKVLGDAGYSGSIRDLYVEMAVAVAQTAPNNMVDFYSIMGGKNAAIGLANFNSSGPGRGQVGLNFAGLETALDKGPGQELRYAQRLVATLAHEISHIDDFILEGMIDAPDAFSNIRRRLRENLNDLAQIADPDQRHAMLSTLKDALIPKESQWQELQKDGRLYGAQSGEEFVAVVNQMLAQTLLHGKKSEFKSALEVLDYSPVEIREYAQGTFRSLHDVMLSMQDTLAHPTIRSAAGKERFTGINPFLTSTMFGAIVNSAREASLLRHADKSLLSARELIKVMEPGAGRAQPAPSPAVWMQTDEEIRRMYSHIDKQMTPMNAERVSDAVGQATTIMSKQAYDKANREGTWMGWFAPFTQRMESMRTAGFPIARPMADLAIGLEGGITRLRSLLLGDYVKRGPSGLVEFNAENPLVKRIAEEKTGPWRNAVNEMSAWQQDKNDGKALFVQDEKGAYVPDPKSKAGVAMWEKVRARLSPEDQNFVAAQIVAMDKSNVRKGEVLRTAMREELEYRVGLTLMAANRGMQYEQAGPYGKQVTAAMIAREEAVRAKDQAGVQAAEGQLGQLLPTPQARATMDRFFGGTDGVLQKLFEKSEIIAGRTGHRSESLVGDWILRVVPPQGGPAKFVAERSEHAALSVLRKLKNEGYTQAGEVVHKSKLADYADFDNHDVTLQKFSSKVSEAYDRMVTEVEGTYGAAVAAQLREFAPSSVIAAEAAKTGLDKYTATRKNTVDRTKYDYIDGELASATKLAASVAYKSVEQQKNLMLADPRAKQFPSFRIAVDEHFSEMMAPTSKWAQEVKAASSAYFMGANLSSAVINAAQSATSLVPVLIQQDKSGMGPVGAWKLLGKATADAFSVTASKNWETRAALAERVSPEKQTLQEAKDALYRKRVLEGGIDHGIIHDAVFSGMDQNAMMLAKFGHGEYAPLSKAEMVRNPVNYLARISMKPFGFIEQVNNKISFMAGVEQGYTQGLRGDALYSFARRVQTLSTYGGGKANAPGLVAKLSNPYTRSAVGVVNNLQQYGYGMVTTYAQLLKDSIGSSPGLSQMEKRQAVKALGTMVITQVATAGALGLPFVGAALTGLEKVFGIPANQAVREGLASLGGGDEEGAVFAETALNGLGNQLFGLDVSSRLGVSNLLGTSSYRGFNLSDMAGPTPSVVANMVEGLSLFGGGEPVKAAKALVPNAFKTVVEMSDSQAKYGDYGMRDNAGSLLYNPSKPQAIAYMMGVRPRELSQKRQAQAMLKAVDVRSQDRVGQEQGRIADALAAGDSSAALRYVQETVYHDPTVNPQQLLRSLVQKGVDRQTEKDLLATGSRASEQERGQVARTFGNDVVTRQSEVQRALLAAQLGARVGLAPDQKTFERAALVDMLVKQRGMVRSEAVRLAGFLD